MSGWAFDTSTIEILGCLFRKCSILYAQYAFSQDWKNTALRDQGIVWHSVTDNDPFGRSDLMSGLLDDHQNKEEKH